MSRGHTNAAWCSQISFIPNTQNKDPRKLPQRAFGNKKLEKVLVVHKTWGQSRVAEIELTHDCHCMADCNVGEVFGKVLVRVGREPCL